MKEQIENLKEELARERKSNKAMAMRLSRMNNKNESLRTLLRLAEFKLYSNLTNDN